MTIFLVIASTAALILLLVQGIVLYRLALRVLDLEIEREMAFHRELYAEDRETNWRLMSALNDMGFPVAEMDGKTREDGIEIAEIVEASKDAYALLRLPMGFSVNRLRLVTAALARDVFGRKLVSFEEDPDYLEEYWLRMGESIEEKEEERVALIERLSMPTLTDEELWTSARSPYNWARALVAAHPNASVDLIDELADDEDETVRFETVKREDAAEDTLWKLVLDENRIISDSAAEHLGMGWIPRYVRRMAALKRWKLGVSTARPGRKDEPKEEKPKKHPPRTLVPVK